LLLQRLLGFSFDFKAMAALAQVRILSNGRRETSKQKKPKKLKAMKNVPLSTLSSKEHFF
jgi:hypothetical protein